MATKLDPGYSEMLTTPAPLEGPRKDAIDSLQQQINLYVAKANQVGYTRNSHLAISGLPAELLSDAFLYVVDSGLQRDGKKIARGTFDFLLVCRRWNEVAIGFPRLWVRWLPGTVKAWPLFSSRSKGAPLFLTWQHWSHDLSRDAVMDTDTPRMFHELDLTGGMEHFLVILNPTSISITSSIRLNSILNDKPEEHLTQFFSSPFPNLSKLDISGFLPDPSSSIFTSSNLTSLKLHVLEDYKYRHTRSQLSQVLHHHPNLQELDLKGGAIPLVEQSGTPVPIVLPQLVDLKLYSTRVIVAGHIDLVGAASPLHNVVIFFWQGRGLTVPYFTRAVKKILTAYYGCPGLDYPRTANRLTVSLDPREDYMEFDVGSHFTPTPHPMSNLKLQFCRIDIAPIGKTIPLFPLKHLYEFTAKNLALVVDDWRTVLREMTCLLHLRLDCVDLGPVFDALDIHNGVEPEEPTVPKLQLLVLYNLRILPKPQRKLLDTLERRSDHDVGLGSLVVQDCQVSASEYEADLRDRVKDVTWKGVVEVDYETETEGTDSDESDDLD